MGIGMAGLDYTTAGVEVRERFSLTSGQIRQVIGEIGMEPELLGVVLLSTCNRTELYFSCEPDVWPEGAALLCRELGLDEEEYGKYFQQKRDREAVSHLMEVAGGLQSQLLGEDQILAQVKRAIELAREEGTADPRLQTLFRLAVTAGKEIKTQVVFPRAGQSVAKQAVDTLKNAAGQLHGKKALVIGNGEIGRLAARHLADAGCQTVMTLRAYRHGTAVLPAGCSSVAYEERYQALENCEIVVSATASPHFTMKREELDKLNTLPRYFVDLAMPRDVEPKVGELPGVRLWNVDDLHKAVGETEADGINPFVQAERIIEQQAKRFYDWQSYREGLAVQEQHLNAPYFPLFISLLNKPVLVVGGGKIATRRVLVLVEFGAEVRVVSPTITPEIQRLVEQSEFMNGTVEWVEKPYDKADLQEVVLVVAATNNREVNRRIGTDCRHLNILASVADRRDECGFYFPAVMLGENLVGGMVSQNGNHTLVRRAATQLRERLKNIEEDYSGR